MVRQLYGRALVTLALLLPAVLAVHACRPAGREAASGEGSGAAAVVRLDPAKVPADLRDLTPLAEKWGIGDDIDRPQLFESVSESEIAALVRALEGRRERIDAWLNSFDPGEPMSDEAAAFMYMLEGLDEIGR
jgi:hypothetical protein